MRVKLGLIGAGVALSQRRAERDLLAGYPNGCSYSSRRRFAATALAYTIPATTIAATALLRHRLTQRVCAPIHLSVKQFLARGHR